MITEIERLKASVIADIKATLPDADVSLILTPVAVDSETLGLNPHRDRLCLVQLPTTVGGAIACRWVDRRTKRGVRAA